MDFVLNVCIWKSGEFCIKKSSRYHLMVGNGSPSNSTSKRAWSCSNARQGWILVVNIGGLDGSLKKIKTYIKYSYYDLWLFSYNFSLDYPFLVFSCVFYFSCLRSSNFSAYFFIALYLRDKCK